MSVASLNLSNKFSSSFKDRLATINIDVKRRLSRSDINPEQNNNEQNTTTSNLRESLDEWREKCLSLDYDTLYSSIYPFSNSFKLVIHNSEKIKTELVNVLNNDLLPVSMESICAITNAFAADLQTDFLPLTTDFFKAFSKILKKPENHEKTFLVEAILNTVSFILAYTWRRIVQNSKNLNRMFQDYQDSFLSSGIPNYVKEFAAESFAFLIRKTDSDNRKILFSKIESEKNGSKTEKNGIDKELTRILQYSIILSTKTEKIGGAAASKLTKNAKKKSKMTAQSDLTKLKIWLHSTANVTINDFIESSPKESVIDFIHKLSDHRIMEHEKVLFPIFKKNVDFLEVYVKLFKPNALKELLDCEMTSECCSDCLRIYKPEMDIIAQKLYENIKWGEVELGEKLSFFKQTIFLSFEEQLWSKFSEFLKIIPDKQIDVDAIEDIFTSLRPDPENYTSIEEMSPLKVPDFIYAKLSNRVKLKCEKPDSCAHPKPDQSDPWNLLLQPKYSSKIDITSATHMLPAQKFKVQIENHRIPEISKFLISYDQSTTSLASELLNIPLIQEIHALGTFNLQTHRTRVMKMTNLRCDKVDEENRIHVMRYLFSNYFINFSMHWPEVTKILVSYSDLDDFYVILQEFFDICKSGAIDQDLVLNRKNVLSTDLSNAFYQAWRLLLHDGMLLKSEKVVEWIVELIHESERGTDGKLAKTQDLTKLKVKKQREGNMFGDTAIQVVKKGPSAARLTINYYKSLKCMLPVFSKIKNPLGMKKNQTVKNLIENNLLRQNDWNMQELGLKALFAYKPKALNPHRELLEELVKTKNASHYKQVLSNLRAKLTDKTEDGVVFIKEEHKDYFYQILIQILWGRFFEPDYTKSIVAFFEIFEEKYFDRVLEALLLPVCRFFEEYNTEKLTIPFVEQFRVLNSLLNTGEN